MMYSQIKHVCLMMGSKTKVKKLYEGRGCEPNPKLGEKQYYLDAWDLRRLYSFALRRQRDAEKRDQTPRDSLQRMT